MHHASWDDTYAHESKANKPADGDNTISNTTGHTTGHTTSNTTLIFEKNHLSLRFTKTSWYELPNLLNYMDGSMNTLTSSLGQINLEDRHSNTTGHSKRSNIVCDLQNAESVSSIGGEVQWVNGACIFNICDWLCSRSLSGLTQENFHQAATGNLYQICDSHQVLWQTLSNHDDFPTLEHLKVACDHVNIVLVLISIQSAGAYVVGALRPSCKIEDAKHLWDRANEMAGGNKKHFFQTDGPLASAVLNSTNLFVRFIPPQHACNSANIALQISQIRDLRRQTPT